MGFFQLSSGFFSGKLTIEHVKTLKEKLSQPVPQF